MSIDRRKTYLKTLAKEHQVHCTTYIETMKEYNAYFENTFRFTVESLKRRPLKQWHVSLLRKLNPSEFDLNSMQEEGKYEEWLQWFSGIRTYGYQQSL